MYAKINSELEKKYNMTEFPLNIGIEVSAFCNLRCVMCGNRLLKRPKGIMPMNLYKKIVDETVQENPGTRLWLDFYGEPLISGYKLYYMIDYAKNSRGGGIQNVCMNTNGQLMSEEYADMLLDSGIDYISFECDGFTKDVYESIRVGGDRDRFYQNVEYILKKKKDTKSKTIIDVKVIEMEENKHEIDQILSYWRERGAWTAVRKCSDWASFKVNKDSVNDNRIACGHAVATCVITWDGNVAGCAWDGDCKVNCGNVKEKSIKEIWQDRNENFVKLHFEHRWEELSDFCQKCTSWQNIGEERFDENGNPRERVYDTEKALY